MQNVVIRRPARMGANSIQSVMLCTGASCAKCYPQITFFLRSCGGLPFVHFKNVVKLGDDDLRFNQDPAEVSPELLDGEAVIVGSCRKEIVGFQTPVNATGFRRSSRTPHTYRVVTAVCVPAECSVCLPASDQSTSDEDSDATMESDTPPYVLGEDGEPMYFINRIVDSRRRGNGFKFKVEWCDYPGEDTWQPLSQMAQSRYTALVHYFYCLNPNAIRPTAAQLMTSGLTLPA